MKKNRKYFFNYEASKSFSSSSDLLKEAGKQMRTVWDIPNNKSKEEMKFGSHPTQKPIKVSERILALCGVEGGNLLVPFAGSGTEMVAGINFGMNVTGFEIEEKYLLIAQKRLDDALQKKNFSLLEILLVFFAIVLIFFLSIPIVISIITKSRNQRCNNK